MLQRIIEEVRTSLDNECFIAALTLALTIPDICGKAEYPADATTKRYIQWYNGYIGHYEKLSDPYGTDMPYLSGELIYNLRSLMLHQGTPNIDPNKVKVERCKVDRFILTITDVCDSGLSGVQYDNDNKITERLLEVNIVNLCHKICSVAQEYYSENQNKFTFFQYELVDKRDSTAYAIDLNVCPHDTEKEAL